jgi:hypothetical protein
MRARSRRVEGGLGFELVEPLLPVRILLLCQAGMACCKGMNSVIEIPTMLHRRSARRD